jgi:hypothetical protein
MAVTWKCPLCKEKLKADTRDGLQRAKEQHYDAKH